MDSTARFFEHCTRYSPSLSAPFCAKLTTFLRNFGGAAGRDTACGARVVYGPGRTCRSEHKSGAALQLRKNSVSRAKLKEVVPQGLKAAFIFSRLRHD